MPSSPECRERSQEWLIFTVGDNHFGIDLLKVHETIVVTHITAVPWAAAKIEGAIALGVKTIPVIDLRDTFHCEKKEGVETNIVVVEVQSSQIGKCWESMNCSMTDCPARRSKESRCWVIPHTLCRNEIQGTFHHKIEACQRCSFFKAAYASRSVYAVGLVVDKLVELIAPFRDADIRQTPEALSDVHHFLGTIDSEGKKIVLLDVDQLFRGIESN